MSKSSTPPAIRINSSLPSSADSERPKRLRLHEFNLSKSAPTAIAGAQDRASENTDAAPDSCNMRAAEWLTAAREALGLTLEEAASVANVSMTTVWRRENGLVDLGPLKQLVRLTKERALRRIK